MIKMTFAQAISVINGSLTGTDTPLEKTFTGISTDSRADCTGTLFVALKGENFNAENFCHQAMDNGAVAVLVTQDTGIKAPQLICQDTIKGLSALGQAWAKKCSAKVIAITGSNGKTTVKNMLKSILSVAHKCCATEGNFNNEIGVPLTLCQIGSDDDFAVIEMGAAQLGDISHLIGLVDAHTTILTNASAAHIGRFGSFENIVTEKGQICAQLTAQQHSVLPIDDEHYDYWLNSTAAQVNSFGFNTAADVKVSQQPNSWDLVTKVGIIEDITLPVVGKHNKANAACACAAALTLDINDEQIKQGLQTFVPANGRLQNMGTINGNLLINDSYNANAASVKAAIDVLNECTGTTTLVFGDMAELGTDSEALHRSVGQYCQQKGITHLLTIGKDSRYASKTFKQNTKHFKDMDALKEHLVNNWQQFGTILVKGSRSMRLEQLIKTLMNEEKVA